MHQQPEKKRSYTPLGRILTVFLGGIIQAPWILILNYNNHRRVYTEHWIGRPPIAFCTVALTKLLAEVCPQKFTLRKIRRSKNSTVSDRESNLLGPITYRRDFFSITVFFSGVNFCGQTPGTYLHYYRIQFLRWGYRILFYWYSLVPVPILWCPCYL